MAKYKVGDEVTVRGVIAQDTDGPRCMHVRFETADYVLSVREDMIATHTPKLVKIGDKVTWGGKISGFRLVFIGGKRSVVDLDGEPGLVATSDLAPWIGD
jgi:hypothetical protein